MQSEKQVAAAQGVLGRGGVYAGAELVKAALEAALSAAEPVGWQWRHPRATGGEWMNCPNGPRADKLSQAEYRPVYAAPTAPSVAVKALEWTQFTDRSLDLNADSIEGAYVIRPSAGNKFPVYLWVPGVPYDDARLKPFNDLEAAKSHAQTHHEALIRSALSAQVQDVAVIETSIDTMRDAAKNLILKYGWQPNHRLSPHSVAGLMAEFGMQVSRGEIGCGYPNCGCCVDAACGDAIKQHPDFAAPAKQEGGHVTSK
ncbi:hypothetical protein EN837_08140 [bacterium M00.F.Ca.ET.194.01.1.1]|nr:hypothetical protein EN837_08140 [bacterium M00.F.Ca.ET.194.01.1.1]TGS56232.1 hypothetical protein EN822_08140 [bacterium M00.F.Ca.ET.179.01.1.1]TGV49137.1 hypothetical protein EN811_08140 [bacterium M00.F.Ca.ET.168.01.1.1]